MRSSNREYTLVSALLVAAVVIIFYQVLGHGFINLDDNVYVTENGRVQEGLTIRSLTWAFTSFNAGNWHPLTWLSHMLDFRLYGPNPLGHHLTSLLLHILNTVLLFLVFVRMTGSLWRSAFVAALFGIHPLHVESVAWASERKDVLSTLFWMLTMLAYVRYAEHPNVRRYLPVAILFALGLMAKPMLVTLPFVLLLLDYWPLGRMGKQGRPIGRLVLEKVPLFILALGSSVVTFLAQRQGGAVNPLERTDLAVRLGNAVVSYVAYILKMLWPAKLAAFYPHPQDALPAWQVVGSAILLVLIAVFVIRAGRPRAYLVVGSLWYVGTLVPVIGFVQVGAQAMADRYTYVPFIGLFTAIAWGLPDLVRKGEWKNGGKEERGKGRRGDKETPTLPYSRTPILTAFALIAVAALMARAWIQVSYWKDSVTLFQHAIRVNSRNYMAHNQLGLALAERGDDESSFRHFAEALRIAPDYHGVYLTRGAVYARQGRYDEAIRDFSQALRSQPGWAEAHFNLATALAARGRYEDATRHFAEALRINPEMEEACRANLQAIAEAQRAKSASGARKPASEKADEALAHFNRGLAFSDRNLVDEAIAEYRKALSLRPDFAEVHNNLAILLYTKGDYSGAWKEVASCRQYGVEPNVDFLNALTERMPEPR